MENCKGQRKQMCKAEKKSNIKEDVCPRSSSQPPPQAPFGFPEFPEDKSCSTLDQVGHDQIGLVVVATRPIVDPNSELVSFCCKLPLQSPSSAQSTPINCHLRPASTPPPCHFCNRQHIIGVRFRCQNSVGAAGRSYNTYDAD
jgi:hypothetical protein